MTYETIPAVGAPIVPDTDYFVIDEDGDKTVAYWSDKDAAWISSHMLIEIKIDYVLIVIK